MKNEVSTFLLALQFLTRLPVSSANFYTPARMAASVRYYPLVGIVIGCLLAVAYVVLSYAFPHTIAVLLSVGIGMLITGGFHEDGLADTFDGIGGGGTREAALTIMKDSRLGTYGTLALMITLSIKVASLILLTPALTIAALIAGHGLSRLSSVIVMATSEYVRDEGKAKPVAERISSTNLWVAIGTGVVCMAGLSHWLSFFALVAIVVGLVSGHVLMRCYFARKIGGYTGDTLGAVQQVSELGIYLGLVAWSETL